MAKVSVIIPFFGVERFISRCAHSLLTQSLQDVEYIFVDDASTDSSMNTLRTVIAKFPHKASQIKFLTHERNKGLPAARNTGLSIATGEYIFHCDSDDFVETDMLENLYNAAVQHNADAVWCDYYLSYENSERYMKQPCYETSVEALKGMLCGRMKYNVWNKLVRRKLYVTHQIQFPSGYAMGEDMTMMKLFSYAERVAYIPKAFYHYVQWNAGAMTREFTPQHLAALKHNTGDILSFMKSQYGNDWNQDIYSFCMLMKWPFLISNKKSMYGLWKQWFPEANAYIWQDKQVSWRIRFIEWCASKGWFGIVWLHYWIVIRWLYSIIYK